ncbi:hypothetical protein PHLCEN_2v5999 [Hermanssonia centrifuga]|uniref:DNL-type domain-containing protein n=1 Tax=Hermanssonia centrifuga TaxID=98765 RepID=A0A2R6P0K8_9APHY|nr:hypothetical protein PHLCEN_2v5999 [Hermanssonia centrifuga]
MFLARAVQSIRIPQVLLRIQKGRHTQSLSVLSTHHRTFASSVRRRTAQDGHSPSNSGSISPPATQPSSEVTSQSHEPRLSLTFTCTVPDCGVRSTHEFTKRSYQKGIVLVQCPGCENRHLIADHLGWFKESTEDGKLKTVEDLMRAKGETVKRGWTDGEGVIEYAPDAPKS